MFLGHYSYSLEGGFGCFHSPLALPSPPRPKFLARGDIFKALELAWSPLKKKKRLESPALQ